MLTLFSITRSITTKPSNLNFGHSKYICREFNGLCHYFVCRFTTGKSQKTESPSVSLGRYFPHTPKHSARGIEPKVHVETELMGFKVQPSCSATLNAFYTPKVQIIHKTPPTLMRNTSPCLSMPPPFFSNPCSPEVSSLFATTTPQAHPKL